jgi:CubicO group peptidase (beta-lactamase class C family)
MDMVIKGEMHLDDPIEKYLPGLKVPDLEGKKITLRHLATHTSGIPRMPDNFSPKDPSNPYQDYTVEHLYDYLQSCTLAKAPGDSLEYSNIGMGLLGHILSIHSGKSYEKLIQSLVAKQFDMPSISVSITDEMATNFASGHHLQQAVSHWDLTPAFAGAGALRSNIKDMANFLAANMGEIASPLSGALHKCHEKQHAVTSDTAFGLGWVLSKSNEADLIFHNGGTGGFRSYLGFNPKTQKGVVILSNSTGDWPDEFGSVILDPDYQRLIVDKTLADNPEYLNKFAGSYELVLSDELPKQQLQISVFGKLLASALSGGEVGMLYPKSHGVFGVKGFPDGKVCFSFDDSGNISKVEASLVSNGTILWKATPTLVQ